MLGEVPFKNPYMQNLDNSGTERKILQGRSVPVKEPRNVKNSTVSIAGHKMLNITGSHPPGSVGELQTATE